MKNNRYGLGSAAKEHIVAGQPITRLEALILFGLQDLTTLIREMRKEGWLIRSKRIPYAAAMRRVNEYARIEPPQNLPIRDIHVTEYRISR